MAQYHARPSTARARSPPPPSPPAVEEASSSSLLFPSLPTPQQLHPPPAAAPPPTSSSARYRSSSALSSASELSTSASSDWSVILPAPSTRAAASHGQWPPAVGAASFQPTTAWSSSSASRAGPPSPDHPYPQALGLLPSHDGQGNFSSPGLGPPRPLLQHARTASGLTQTTLDDSSADDLSSFSSTDLESSSASEPDRSPALSPLALVATQPFPLPPAGFGFLGGWQHPPGRPTSGARSSSSSAGSSPSPPPPSALDPTAESLSRVPTIVGLSRMPSSSSAAASDTAGFRSTVRARTATPRLPPSVDRRTPFASRRDTPAQHQRLLGTSSPGVPSPVHVERAPAGPLPSSLASPSSSRPSFLGRSTAFLWPARPPPATAHRKETSAEPSALATAFRYLRSLLSLDEHTLLLLFAPPAPIASASAAAPTTTAEPSPHQADARRLAPSASSATLTAAGEAAAAARPRLARRRSSSEPGTESRRALLLLAVGRMTVPLA